jgi:acyl-CoA reductase-like NAD-dependent aldehyde dehydrogenase
MPISTLNPTTGELIESYEAYSKAQGDQILDGARSAQRTWGRVDIDRRATALQPLAELLRARVEEYATLMTLEMGKPIT